jgi:hypothetical protein
MSNNFSRAIWLFLTGALVFTGCERQQEQQAVFEADTNPDVAMPSVGPDYVMKAVEGVGGRESWAQTRELQLDCVVTFYQAGGSFYLTEQHHVVEPWSNSIRISALEPAGRFAWELSRGRFSVLQADGQEDALPATIGVKPFAEMILTILTIPARFFDEAAEFSRQTTPLKVHGQWYYPIDRLYIPVVGTAIESQAAVTMPNAVFYQNRDTFLIDMILFDFKGEDSILAVRGYDYAEVERNGVLVPSRVEIFRADASGNLHERLVKTDYHTLERSK